MGVELGQLLCEEKLDEVLLLVLVIKQDLVNALTAEEISDGLNLSSIVDRPWNIHPSSAKSGEGIQEGMEWVVDCVNDEM